VTIQAQILELLRKLQKERGMAILLITHDLGVVAENADVVNVMYASRIVESATVEELFDRPRHPYTEGLFRSVPRLRAHSTRLATIPGTVPNPARFPVGCKFHPRCHRTRELAATAPDSDVVQVTAAGETFKVLRSCVENEPALHEVDAKHWSACHKVEGYDTGAVSIPNLNHKRLVTPEVRIIEGASV
jgi:oligopeptide/dipeptide ABC transporter ATP-binding protein